MNNEPSPLMRKVSRFVLMGVVMLLMITQFNNCGNYQAADSTLDSMTAVACLNESCISPDANNLSVIPHLGNGEYAVTAGLAEFNLGGDCNEAGFVNNYIHWDLVDNSGAVVRHSGMQIVQGLNMESKCVNGRFLIYVILSPINLNNADPYDRTGLMTPNGVRTSYNLHITIFGSDPKTGASGQYQTNVPLSAI